MQQILSEYDKLSEFVQFNSLKYREHLALRHKLWFTRMIARISVCGLLLLVCLINLLRVGG